MRRDQQIPDQAQVGHLVGVPIQVRLGRVPQAAETPSYSQAVNTYAPHYQAMVHVFTSLFGCDTTLTLMRLLCFQGQYATRQNVILIWHHSRAISNLRVIGPCHARNR